ncbi:hypothetical protein BD410DRAFT_789365 [Rickenella mellea]|uniref:Uncharacterized protein n=1 Tax=Rickenella mellea TaxID=50990 RepID=A0A4Y7Q1U5_9AGAM|nr:hypothetical protein BD410DRAFT_789365 [Rickenella mellea]
MAKTIWSRNGQENDNSENGSGGPSKLGPQGQEQSATSSAHEQMMLPPSKSGLFSRIKGMGRQADPGQGQGNNSLPNSPSQSSFSPTPRGRTTQTAAEKRRAEALKANGLLPASRRYSAILPPNVVWTEPKADGGGKDGMSSADLVKRDWEARTAGEREGGGSAPVEKREAEDRNVNATVDAPPRTPGKPKKKPDLAIAVLPQRPSTATKDRISGAHSPKAVFNSWKFPSSPNLNTSNLSTPTFLQTITSASPISAPGSDTDEDGEEDSGSDEDGGTQYALLSPRFVPLPRSPGRSPKGFLSAPPSPSLIPLPASPQPSQSYFDAQAQAPGAPPSPSLIPLPASPLPSQTHFGNTGAGGPTTPTHVPLPLSRAPSPSPIPSPLPSPRLAQKPIPSFPPPPVPPSPRFVPLPTSPSPNTLAFSASSFTSFGAHTPSPPGTEKVSQWLTRSPATIAASPATGGGASTSGGGAIGDGAASEAHESLTKQRTSTFPLTPVSPVARSWSNTTTATTATSGTQGVPPPPPLSPSTSSTVSPSLGTTDSQTPPSTTLPTLPPNAHIKETRNGIHRHKAHLSQSSVTSTSSESSNLLGPERAFLHPDREHDLDLGDLTLELPPVPILPAAREEEEKHNRSSSPLSFASLGSFNKRRTAMKTTVAASTLREPRKSINLFGRRKATNETPPPIYTGKSPLSTSTDDSSVSMRGSINSNKRKSILPSFGRSKTPTMPNPNLSALQSPPLPSSPASGMSFATGSSSTGHGHGRGGKLGPGEKVKSPTAKRMPLSPTMHSRATIMAQAGRIEDDDTRRLTEMAFLS